MSRLQSSNTTPQAAKQHKVSLFRRKPCANCESVWHTKFKCPYAQRKGLNKIGRVGRETANYVARWKLKQNPNHEGYYICYIGGDPVSYLRAEHPYSKARHPDKRIYQKLEPVCDPHNELKGSLDIDDFLEKYPQFKLTVKKEYLRKDL